VAIDQTTFEALIARTEALAARNPRVYKWRVVGVALLGYLYLAFVVVVLLALLVLVLASVTYLKLAALKLILFVGAPLLMVFRSLRVKLEPPSGVRLNRAASPELFRMLDDLRQNLKTPRLHRVLLMSDFNAGVTQVPRLGLFGWHQNYLVIGLPLMKALTVDQFRAVLAHELGHLSGGHARATNWIYRLRLIWQRLDAEFSQTRHWGSALIQPFFKRYIPYFTAMSFPLARANEYEADATAVRLTCARSAAQALTSVGVVTAYLNQKYWPTIHQAAKDLPQPAFAPYSEFSASTVEAMPPESRRQWLEEALATRTSYADTHPCLADRLRAIGVAAEFSPPTTGQSADALLGPDRASWECAFDEEWRTRVAQSWTQVHERTQASRLRIVELRAKATTAALDESAALELVNLEEEVGEGPVAALAMRRSLVEQYPNSLPIRFALARQLLTSGEEEGVAAMVSVVGAEPEALLPGAQLLRDFYASRNDMARASDWHEKVVARATLLQEAERERAQWLASDTIVAHKLSGEEIATLNGQLKAIPEVRRAYVVRKLVRHFPETPMYILGYEVTPWWRLHSRSRATATLQRIRQDIYFPGRTLIVSVEGRNYKFGRRMRRVRGSRIV
jgi:Zn-dependent protease with chaperone function